MKTSDTLQRLIELLETEVWIPEDCTISHARSGISIWTANGFWEADLYPAPVGFSLRQKWKLRQATGRCAGRMAILRATRHLAPKEAA